MKNSHKRLLALALALVLAFANINFVFADGMVEQVATSSDFTQIETQITSPAALAVTTSQTIQPINAPIVTDPDRIININNLQAGDGVISLWSFDAVGGRLSITGDGSFRVEGDGTVTTNHLHVSLGVTANIILSNVDILPSISQPALIISTEGANATVWLDGDNRLISSNAFTLGVMVNSPSLLTINGPGSLTVVGGSNTNGISTLGAGEIIINSGTIDASSIAGNITVTGNPTITTTGGNPVVWITQQPQSPTPMTEGSISGSLSVTAHTSQGTTSYQWYQNGSPISGANGASLTIPTNLTATGSPHSFHVVVSSGTTSITSETAVVTVDPIPTFTVTVASTGTGATGGGNFAQGQTVNVNAGTPPTGQQFFGSVSKMRMISNCAILCKKRGK